MAFDFEGALNSGKMSEASIRKYLSDKGRSAEADTYFGTKTAPVGAGVIAEKGEGDMRGIFMRSEAKKGEARGGKTRGEIFKEEAGKSLGERQKTITNIVEGKEGYGQTGVEKAVQFAGQGLGFVGDLVGAAFKAENPQTQKQIEEGVKYVLTANAEKGMDIESALQEFQQKYPRASANVGAITTILGSLEGTSQLKNLAKKSVASKTVREVENVAPGASSAIGKAFPITQTAEELEKQAITSVKSAVAARADVLKNPVVKQAWSDLAPQNPTATEIKKAVTDKRYVRTGILREDKMLPGNREIGPVEAYGELIDLGYVKKGMKPQEKIETVDRRISELNSQLSESVEANSVPFNENQLRSKLAPAKEEARFLFAGDRLVENAYDNVIDKAVEFVTKKNTKGLLDARKELDVFMRTKFPKLVEKLSSSLGEDVRANAYADVRKIFNDYVIEQLPENHPYKAILKKESDLIRAKMMLERNLSQEVGSTVVGRAIKRVPVLGGAVKAFTQGTTAGAVLGQVIK